MKIALILVCFLFVSNAYSNPNDSPEAVYSKFIELLLSSKIDLAYELISSADKAVLSKSEYLKRNSVGFNAATEFMLKNTKYKIIDKKIINDKAILTIEHSFPDFMTIIRIVSIEQMKYKSEMEKLDYIEKEYKDKIPLNTNVSEDTLIKESDGWKIYLNQAEQMKKAQKENDHKKQILLTLKDKLFFNNIEISKHNADEYSITGYIQNKSDNIIKGVKVIFYGLDEDQKAIFEKEALIIYNTGKDEDKLKTNYIKRFVIFLYDHEAPKEWQMSYKIEIIEIEIE
jgi:hypothetical protein